MKGAAKLISVIFHPLLVPSLGFLILFNSGTYHSFLDIEIKRMIFFLVMISTLIIPLLMTLFLNYQKMFYSFAMPERRERVVPLSIVLIFYIFCFILLKRIPIPPMYHAFSFASAVVVLIALIITLNWKVSLHMVGLGGLTGMILFLIFSMRVDLQFYLMLTITAAGLAGTSRLQLSAHQPSQLVAGYITGLVTVPLVMWVY